MLAVIMTLGAGGDAADRSNHTELILLREENSRLRSRLQGYNLREQLVHSSTGTVGSGLSALVDVAELDANGAIRMPHNTTYVFMEIGCSDRDTMDQDTLPKHKDAFLISFEPLLDKYAVLLARGTQDYHQDKRDMSVPLGHHHRHGVVLPFAVSATGGSVRFHVSRVAGCSSMLKVNRSTRWAQWCLSDLETRRVPSLTLETALGLAGRRPIRQLKLDAQGADLSLLQSVAPGVLRRRVEAVQMEVVADDCNPLYVGQALCTEVMQRMQAIGFRPFFRGRAMLPGGAAGGCRRSDFALLMPERPEQGTCEIDPLFLRGRLRSGATSLIQ